MCFFVIYRLKKALKSYFNGSWICLVAVFLTFNAKASDWESVGLMDLGVFYIDVQSITKPEPSNSHLRQVWTMLDYREPQKTSRGSIFRSTRSMLLFNCQSGMVKTLSISWHSGARLSGQTLESEGVMDAWQPIAPQTPLVNIRKAVCDR
jgi:hypothetical protein